MAEIHPTNKCSEQHHRGSLLNDLYSVGKDGNRPLYDLRVGTLLCQLGWNRGSYKGSRPLHMQGMGVFF